MTSTNLSHASCGDIENLRQTTGGITDMAALEAEVRRMSQMLKQLSEAGGRDLANRSLSSAGPFIDDYRIDRLHSPSAEGNDAIAQPPVTSEQVRAILQQRRTRDEYFDDGLFADPAWDMMLDLYASTLDRKRVSVSSLCIAAAVPSTTALRWIKLMESKGHFIRTPDIHDARRVYIALSKSALTQLHRYFTRLSQSVSVV